MLKEQIKANKNNEIFAHISINAQQFSDKTVSIVMRSCDTSLQAYKTLRSISCSKHKEIQVIIVDDSISDPLDISVLEATSLHIDLIKININNKTWINPVISYNIGFQFVKGDRLIIQKAEVCHVGDVIKCVKDNTIEGMYDIYQVKMCVDVSSNNRIYNEDVLDISILDSPSLFCEDVQWYYNNPPHKNHRYLTALTASTLKIVKGFSFDYTMGLSYDDDDFILRIADSSIGITYKEFSNSKCGGIHLFHKPRNVTQSIVNDVLYAKKKYMFQTQNKYIDVTESLETFDNNYKQLFSVPQKSRSGSF